MAISLKAARVNAQYTQKEAANALKICKGTLARYENGKATPKMDMAQKIAALYGCTVNDLIFLHNDCA